jgi:hypothetical protein
MGKQLVARAAVVMAVVLVILSDPALAGGARYPRYQESGHPRRERYYRGQHYYRPHYGNRRVYRPPVQYYAPPRRYYAPPARYFHYHPYSPGVDVHVAVPLPFCSFYLW